MSGVTGITAAPLIGVPSTTGEDGGRVLPVPIAGKLGAAGIERGAGMVSGPRCLGGVSMIIEERAPSKTLLRGRDASGVDIGLIGLRRDETGVEGAIGSVGFARGSGIWGTRNRSAPLLADEDTRRKSVLPVLLVSNNSLLGGGRVGVSWIDPDSAGRACRRPLSLVSTAWRDLNGFESGPENEIARRLEDGIIIGDSARE